MQAKDVMTENVISVDEKAHGIVAKQVTSREVISITIDTASDSVV